MSYGIQTFDNQGRVQFDTTRGEDTGLVVVDAGTATSISSIPDDARVFVNISPTSGNIGFVCAPITSGTMNFFGTATSESGPFDSTQPVSVNYIVARPGSSLTYTGNTYGFQCTNGDGDILFDSRYLNGDGGFAVGGYSDPYEHNGDTFGTASNASNLITSDYTVYVDVANTFFGTVGSNTGTMVKGRYIVFANNFTCSSSSVGTSGYRTNSTGRKQSGNITGAFFYHQRRFPGGSGYVPNPATILYGDEI